MHQRLGHGHGLDGRERQRLGRQAAEAHHIAGREVRPDVLAEAGDGHFALDTERARARFDHAPRRAVADQQSSRGEACPAQPRDGFDELDVVLLGPQHRGDPDHVVGIRVAELGTQRVPLERAAVVLKMPCVDAVVDHRVAA
ncbi:MAG: hypothetical protein E6K46_01940 [Gammaproteobacteria bacterium]|nr:MAG: hypothetical protein E6K46_01940 [Gammaproteobacteria bacterium]